MTRLAAALLVWVAAVAGAAAAGPAPATADDPELQILVLIPMPPEHFRPGRSYSGSYGDDAGRSARRRIALELAHDNGLGLVSDWPIAAAGVDCYVMSLAPGQGAGRSERLRALARDPRVAWAQPMNVYRAQSHNDPLFLVQPVAAAWHLDELHRLATGRQVRVAVIDSGVELAHPDLAGQVEQSRNFVAGRPYAAERHGTEVAGIIAALADNHLGIAGVAPQSRLLALRACWQESAQSTLCSSLSLAQALDYAIGHDAQVVNLSLGGPPDALLGRLIDVALRRGIAVVAAVDRGLPAGGFPASHGGVVAVAADEPGAAPAAGVWLAPGLDVPTTGTSARWVLVSGSSYAAAHVSGLLALLRETPRTASGHEGGVALARLPGGAIDACASLLQRTGSCACACPTTQTTPQAGTP